MNNIVERSSRRNDKINAKFEDRFSLEQTFRSNLRLRKVSIGIGPAQSHWHNKALAEFSLITLTQEIAKQSYLLCRYVRRWPGKKTTSSKSAICLLHSLRRSPMLIDSDNCYSAFYLCGVAPTARSAGLSAQILSMGIGASSAPTAFQILQHRRCVPLCCPS
jgi:hypothetical protein